MPLTLTELFPEEIAATLGLKAFQGRQIFRWIHLKQQHDFAEMTDLSKDLRQRLANECQARQMACIERLESPETGDVKALFRLEDGATIESVLLRHGDRLTLCLSTQVGCPLGCSFCATGASGYLRDLSAGEMVEQVLELLAPEVLGERTPNIVYMGMGEPFLNYDAVVRSIRLLMCDQGLNVGARKITVSTAGHVPGIRRFAQEDWQVRLSVSLHAANDALRSKLVPMNRQYPLLELFAALEEYQRVTGRLFTFEWVLLAGVNDTMRDAEELAARSASLKADVNLIPYNPVDGSDFSAPSPQRCEAFRKALLDRGVKATLRREHGQDIQGACGQLRRRTEAESH